MSQHDTLDLMRDALRLGLITQAGLLGKVVGKAVGGTALEDVGGKYLDTFAAGRGNKNLALSAERV